MPNPYVPPQRTPSGGAMWFPWVYPQEPDMGLWWPGPGCRLWLMLKPFDPAGTQVVIEHPTASDTYDRLDQAKAAVARFVKRCDPEEHFEYLEDQREKRELVNEERQGSAGMAGYDEAMEGGG